MNVNHAALLDILIGEVVEKKFLVAEISYVHMSQNFSFEDLTRIQLQNF